MATSAHTPSRFLDGPMFKRGKVVKGWKYRWFVLDRHAGLLSYYTSKDDVGRGLRRGCIRLKRALVGTGEGDECGLSIHVANRTCLLKAQNFEERERWVHALDSCIRHLHQPVRHLELTLPESRKGVNLDQRMAETEGYYQLLHEQVRSILLSLNTTEEASQIRQTSKTMLEALRQCIDTMKDVRMRGDSKQLAAIPEGAGEEEEEEEGELGRETAYSSDSESSASSLDFESDEYFDADSEQQLEVGVPGDMVPSVDAPLDNPPDVEEDELFHDMDDNTSSIRSHRSVVFHILSQLRLGMDLTRISLPAFMLERRSFLEMVGEFLAHPDLFANIADQQDPRQRIVAVLRFYLSSLHAGRSSEVAKKPYNPILGETFQCYWNIPNARRTPPDENTKRLLESGPVPFANYDSVAYVAEQVSHHPPITAFYAECPAKRMYMSGSIQTKSGILGLSIGMQNVGTLNFHLLDCGEEYVLTFPNIYVRSVLSIPWLEMGGVCPITCAQSEYSGHVEFHCKPFYGGKKHWITAEAHHVTDKKPFLKVEGEWNGVMYTKHPNGDQGMFLDTVNTPTVPKKVRRLSAQDPGESRRRWHHVTEALKKRDMEAASDAKHMIEEQQRVDTRERQRLGIEWKQKYFHAEGQAWVYNNPLSKRLKELNT